MKYVVGIDEVGRGPLAGPVAVGAVVFLENDLKKIKKLFAGAKDSKKMSHEKRVEIFEKVKKAKILEYIVRYQSAQMVDELGINKAIQRCLDSCLYDLKINPKNSQIFLDGGLKAGKKFINQKTIIKGDDKILAISLASIVAKVSRDSLMVKMAKKYPQYSLDVHKGYGTEKHRKAIKKYGLTPIHRKTFTKA